MIYKDINKEKNFLSALLLCSFSCYDTFLFGTKLSSSKQVVFEIQNIKLQAMKIKFGECVHNPVILI